MNTRNIERQREEMNCGTVCVYDKPIPPHIPNYCECRDTMRITRIGQVCAHCEWSNSLECDCEVDE
jgi:hypothetical protein